MFCVLLLNYPKPLEVLGISSSCYTLLATHKHTNMVKLYREWNNLRKRSNWKKNKTKTVPVFIGTVKHRMAGIANVPCIYSSMAGFCSFNVGLLLIFRYPTTHCLRFFSDVNRFQSLKQEFRSSQHASRGFDSCITYHTYWISSIKTESLFWNKRSLQLSALLIGFFDFLHNEPFPVNISIRPFLTCCT